MAKIVLGLGSSHSPQLNTTTDWWTNHAERDKKNGYLLGRDGEVHNYQGLAEVAAWAVPPEQLTPEVWESKYNRAQASIETLKGELLAAAPDVVVVVGDDQNEMFLDDGMPAFGVYYGDSLYDYPVSEERKARLMPGQLAAQWAFHDQDGEKYTVPSGLGEHVVRELVSDEFDVTAVRRQPEGRNAGHAFTFVRRRLMGETMIPLLPVLLNSYNLPNVPSPRRAYYFGRSLRRAIETFPEDLRVAVVASGGLSHFVVDEELDHRILDGLRDRDAESLSTIPRKYMRSGTSEGLNWIAGGAALEGLSMQLVDYVPAYRSPVGTGVGMAFAVWK
jgi:hypothetical protein